MSDDRKKKIIAKGRYEKVISFDDHFYITNLKQRICVMPYTISNNGLIDQMGVIKDFNAFSEKFDYTLINGYVSEDDHTDLVAANRLIYEILGSNVTSANNWMYLGTLTNTLLSNSEIKLYCVNITDVTILTDKEIQEVKKERNFEMVPTNKVVTSNDSLFLSAYLRLLNYFYVNSLK
jgi:hypothetical protein